jgi:hypothetical protein
MRMAKRHILDNYDVDKDGAEKLAEEATEEAITDLQMDGVINNNLKPINEYEEDVESYWSYLGTEPGDEEDTGLDEKQDDEKGDEEQDESVDFDDSSETQEEDDVDESADDDTDYCLVRVTSDIPEFKGVDLDNYGPFEEGEEVRVPKDNADILTARGNAEFVDKVEQEDEQEDVVTPDSDWQCTCGAFNEEDRTVRKHPKCVKEYREVVEETERSN